MYHQGKNNKGWNTQFFMLLPAIGFLFPKKTRSDELDENSLDFHLDMIKKIDKLLAEHNIEPPSDVPFHAPSISPAPSPVPIESRPVLKKTLSHREITWEPVIEPPQTITQTIPDEFKTELSINPEFRFITNKEFNDMILHTRQSPEDRIEIIDLSAVAVDNTELKKKLNITDIANQTDETHNSFLINEVLGEGRRNKKIEIIDIQNLKQKIHENFFFTPMNKTEKKEKAHVYFFSSKIENNTQQKKVEVE
ncbi:Uncharacterised protein [uncultured archaeon]|nr:Uncharacterised protein [uncultured archaeon]